MSPGVARLRTFLGAVRELTGAFSSEELEDVAICLQLGKHDSYNGRAKAIVRSPVEERADLLAWLREQRPSRSFDALCEFWGQE